MPERPKTVLYPSRPGEVPRVHHWAIVTGGSHSDGYDGTSYHLDYVAYLDRAEWAARIESMEQERGYTKDYAAFEVFPASVKREVVVQVDSQK
jgi:hypothetical protein